jgi:hypothetical protein
MEHAEENTDRQNRRTRRKTSTYATSFTTKATWIGMELNIIIIIIITHGLAGEN